MKIRRTFAVVPLSVVDGDVTISCRNVTQHTTIDEAIERAKSRAVKSPRPDMVVFQAVTLVRREPSPEPPIDVIPLSNQGELL